MNVNERYSMLQKIKNYLMVLSLPFAMMAPLALAPVVHAADIGNCGSIRSSLNQGINSASANSASCSEPAGGSGSADGLRGIASKIVNLLSVIVGIVAVIMIIVGGFRYIASGGASDKVSGAKNTLIYAIVGLIIVALAQFIVHFVLSNVNA